MSWTHLLARSLDNKPTVPALPLSTIVVLFCMILPLLAAHSCHCEPVQQQPTAHKPNWQTFKCSHPTQDTVLLLLFSDESVPQSTFLVHTKFDFSEVEFSCMWLYGYVAIFLLLEQLSLFSVKVCRMESTPLLYTCT